MIGEGSERYQEEVAKVKASVVAYCNENGISLNP